MIFKNTNIFVKYARVHVKNSRRQFMILSAAGACTLALNDKVQAQAMVSETDPQAATWVRRLMPLKWIKQNIQSMPPVKSVITAPFIKVSQALLLVVALCLALYLRKEILI